MSAVLSEPPAAALASPTDLSFGAADFERVRRLIHARAGISLNDSKQAMVYSRLSRLLRETRHASFHEYLDHLEHASGPQADAQWQAFVNCLTTNLTSFFREPHHFETLREELLARRGGPVRLWCAAASTGEEPYSMAITALETLDAVSQVHILATDIDTQVLSTAGRGVYADSARGLTPDRLKRHFMRGTRGNAGRIRVRPELARLIDFQPFNLMSARWDSLGEPFHIVFCRNVMIYFDAATQRRVLERIHAQMVPHGLLCVGHSENFSESRDLFELRGKTVYRRT